MFIKVLVAIFFLFFGTPSLADTHEEIEYYNNPIPLHVYTYSSAKNLAFAYFESKDMDKVVTHNITTDMVETTETIREFVVRLKKDQGVWGYSKQFANEKTQIYRVEIHVWSLRTVPYARLLEFFAHELGHLEHKSMCAPSEKYGDELRAYSYARVAVLATSLAIAHQNKRPSIPSTRYVPRGTIHTFQMP